MALRIRVALGVTAIHVGTNASIPSGWTRVTALDGRFPKQIPNSSTGPGTTGGSSAAHDHVYPQHSAHVYNAHGHSGTWGDSPTHSPSANNVGNQFTIPVIFGHLHASTSATTNVTVGNNSAGNVNTTSADPLHTTVIFIRSNGTPTGIPVNGVVLYNGAAPSGFSAYGTLDDRLMKGAATGGDGGTQAGTPTHTHVSASHTHTPTAGHGHVVSLVAATGSVGNSGGATADGAHTHTLGTSGGPSAEPSGSANTETSGNGLDDPAWQKMRAVQKTTDVGVALGMICLWTDPLAIIPAGWKLCDGANGTPNLSQGLYVKAAATDGAVGNTGGSTTHTHPATGAGHTHGSTGAHTHTITTASGLSGTTTSGSGGALSAASVDHSHTSTTYTSASATDIGTTSNQANALAANSSDDPLFTTVAYIQLKVAAMHNAFFEI